MSRPSPEQSVAPLPMPEGHRPSGAWPIGGGGGGGAIRSLKVEVRRRAAGRPAAEMPAVDHVGRPLPASPAAENASPSIVGGSHAYCRQARRLRARFARRPGRLHRYLRELSRRHDAREFFVGNDPDPQSAPAAAPHRARTAAAAFTALVAEALTTNPEGRVLRYSRRLALLREAKRLGVGRFQANLILASCEHGNGPGGRANAGATGRVSQIDSRTELAAPTRRGGNVGLIVAVLLVQSFILLELWRILAR